MTDINTNVLRRIRATRSDPPRLAAQDPARRRRYTAALEQFEELLTAAGNVGLASRPLPLFYALVQAGAAIAAARSSVDGGMVAAPHGLTLHVREPSPDGLLVRGISKGVFPHVAGAIGSAGLANKVSVGALWSSLPEASGDPIPGTTHPLTLRLDPEDSLGGGLVLLTMTAKAKALVTGLPTEFAEAEDKHTYLSRLLAQYPSAAGWESAVPEQVVSIGGPSGTWGTRLQWRLQESTGSGQQRAEYLLTRIAPRYDAYSHGWLRPRLCPDFDNPTLLMTWWALLFGLSMMARYHPEEWIDMLDLNSSRFAVSLETMLDDGLSAVPRLILEDLTGLPYLEKP